ncbi:flagellar biosynthesis regulator FlaF [Aestuariivita sp.]|jgi:flagellar protein FlaF|uniref:flagellar biosynthesis regulator FlaF n=1 Tax=Aestuariivita sp. TaxID=1872407 RepID=UPI0021730097|nr:flagellar biosynthesis regulator FlaF [Aestuariivita sp.]MCE8008964.1 flagellar biosynthesis regulator FlaF [Aestuariivita sp.]
MGINAYRQTIAKTEAPRQIERRLLSEATSLLLQHTDFDALETKEEKLAALSGGVRDAIWKNEQIWLAFKFDLAEQENGLPPQVRASLISLALWVEKHSVGVLRGTQKIKPLIDINRSIIRGLSGDASEEGE